MEGCPRVSRPLKYLSPKGFKDIPLYLYVMEPVVGIPIEVQKVIDQINYILSGHTISSNTEEPDEPIKFRLDENGDVDIDPT